MKTRAFLCALGAAAGTFAAAGAAAGEIVCEGAYGRHLQGVATDGAAIYWSFTDALVKTDLAGRKVLETKVPSHHGDLCVKTGVVYVAVNLGKFNTETGGVSCVMAYDAATFAPRGTWKLDLLHGAGGMTWKGDRFYVVGGLPPFHEKNYVYEYDGAFNLVKRHELDTGYTWMGIQTAAYEGGRFLFGIYGSKGDPAGLLVCPDDLSSFTRYAGRGDVGIATIGGRLHFARVFRDKGAAAQDPNVPTQKGALAPAGDCFADAKRYDAAHLRATGKGRLLLTFDDRNFDAWESALPLFAKHGAHATFFISGAIDARATAAMRALHAAGHTVGLHGRRHAHRSVYPDARAWYDAEVKEQLAACRRAGFSVACFGFPYNAHDAEMDALLFANGFTHLRAGSAYVNGAHAYQPLFAYAGPYVKPEALATNRVFRAVGIGAAFRSTAPDCVRAVRRVAETGETLCFFSHAIGEDPGKWGVTPALLEAILAEAKRLGVVCAGFDELQ